MRGVKNPGAPSSIASLWYQRIDRLSCEIAAEDRAAAGSSIRRAGSGDDCLPELRSLLDACSGGLPAISAALIAPIEIPATQSGWRLASASAWYTPP